MTIQIPWDEYFIDIAYAVAKRATCPVRQVGAVLVNPNTNAILSVGYNGAPRETSHCGMACENREHGQNREACRAVHAELNAIFNAALNGVSLNGCVAYCTIQPCGNCAKALIQVGCSEVVFHSPYPHTDGLDWLTEAGIPYNQFLFNFGGDEIIVTP